MNETTKTDAAAIAGSNMLAIGLFICNDKDGKPCTIGDRVRITEPKSRVFSIEKGIVMEGNSTVYEGMLLMDIKQGFYLKGKGIHFQPPFNETPSRFNGRETWIWERL